MGLHLGWIPNEPGLRPRAYERAAPPAPEADPGKVAALQAAQHARGMWARLLVAFGLFALVLFGAVAAVAHAIWAWGAAAGIAFCCWLCVVLLGQNRRRAAARLRAEADSQATRHTAELAEYEQGRTLWAESEAERIATAPRWLQVAAHEDIGRLDVFGGTPLGRRNMVTGLGWDLLEQRAVIVLDLSQDRVADGLLAAAARAGISATDYRLPQDLSATPLLAGLSGDEIASLIVEVVHADDVSATAAGRATDLMILRKVMSVLGPGLSMGRLHAALGFLITGADTDDAAPTQGEGTAHVTATHITAAERAALRGLFGDGFRHQIAGNLVRLAAVLEPLSGLGAAAGPRPPARLTCLSLADGPRDVGADLTAALVVQWVTRAVSAQGAAGGGASGAQGGGHSPAVLLAGADQQSARHLARLTAVCERYDVPLVRAFSRLTEESARHLDTRHTAFMRLATRPEAYRAAEHIGLERRFVAARFAHRHTVSRSKTRTTSESVTQTTGRTEGGATTHTTGTITGQAYSEARVPRHDQQVNVNVHVQDRPQGARGAGQGGGGGGRQPSGKAGASGGSAPGKDGGTEKRASEPRPRGGSGGLGLGGGGRKTSTRVAAGGTGGRPKFDIIKTRTRFTAKHESDSTTRSWSATEETSHTTSTSQSRTEGVSVGDEIGYELVYDHKVQPETLMALPEDQMLAPNIVEAAGAATRAVTSGEPGAGAESKLTESTMVALVIDPAVVGGEQVAPVRPDEIPAFEPPTPAVSAHVPDYERAPRTPLGPA